ncbi:MAG: primosomal protein N', partial [Pseudomonadota bacterium]
MTEIILRIAVPSPLFRPFDYLSPASVDASTLQPGVRIRVPFGRRKAIGILLEVRTQSDIEHARLKPALAILDTEPVINADVLAMTQWASAYYHYPIGETLSAALPTRLRSGQALPDLRPTGWRLTTAGMALDVAALQRAPRQARVITTLQGSPDGLARSELDVPASILRTLNDKGWIEPCLLESGKQAPVEIESAHSLNPAQQAAVGTICASLAQFKPFLLEGVTGSGKTEVYLQAITSVIAADRQTLVLVPEIGLTPQLVDRFRRRFPLPIAVLHSGLADRERLAAWQQARSGEAPIIIGTRSAIFTPLARPGLLIIDEEHDSSLKQQDGLRYSARDLAVWRARHLGIPVVLGSATPSLESLFNVEQQRYRHLDLPERTGTAQLPDFAIIDVRKQPLEQGLSRALLNRIRQHLEADGQVLLFLNRRGFAPTLICRDCGWIAECKRCDARMTLHQREQELRCHHCGSQRPIDPTCPACGGSELRPLGQGTERVEQALTAHFPDVECLRIDRDTTRRKGELASHLARAESGAARILLGTQMLAKGHHFPGVTLAAILNADQGLFGTDFRSSERMAQLIVQVAGRAGRHDRAGEVVIQTHHPDHPLLLQLIHQGYPAFAHAALAERNAAGLPPATHIALIRAEATRQSVPLSFLEGVRERTQQLNTAPIEIWGPVPATMERRAGRFRAQLLLQSGNRGDLQRALGTLVRQLEQAKEARQVRWSVDVDPADTF